MRDILSMSISNTSSSKVIKSGREVSSTEVGAVDIGRFTRSLDTQSCQPTCLARAAGAFGRIKSVVRIFLAASTFISKLARDRECKRERAAA